MWFNIEEDEEKYTILKCLYYSVITLYISLSPATEFVNILITVTIFTVISYFLTLSAVITGLSAK